MKKEIKKGGESEQEKKMILPKKNLLLLLIGFLIIVLGFLLMVGGGSESPDVFNYEMFNFRRITLAPLVVLFGFGFLVYAIMKRSKK